MGLVEDLVAAARRAPALVVTNIAVGPRFTGLAAARRPGAPPVAGGAAYTGNEDVPGFEAGAATAAAAARVIGRWTGELVDAVAGRDHTTHLPSRPSGAANGTGTTEDGAIGAAALNATLAGALVTRGTEMDGTAEMGDENGLDLIARLGAGKRLAVVGAFPYLKTIRVDAARSWVLELDPAEDEVPATAAPEVLPQADVVGITGSTLANGTLEGLLALCRRDAFVAVIGPTTPLSLILFDYGVDVLCGALADDADAMVASLLAGGSTRRLPGTRQVSLRPNRGRRT
jgi:hypothetical protein